MNLVTPDSGLIFWMTLAFAIVFFILAKFGFPMISNMVEARREKIEKSLKDAEEAQAQLAQMNETRNQMLRQAREEQTRILSDADRQRNEIIAKAGDDARKEAESIMAAARIRIANEREEAMRDIRARVASLSVDIAEKVLMQDMSDSQTRARYMDKALEELEKEDKK